MDGRGKFGGYRPNCSRDIRQPHAGRAVRLIRHSDVLPKNGKRSKIGVRTHEVALD